MYIPIIEFKTKKETVEIIGGELRNAFGDSIRASITVYDGVVLLTGDTIGNDVKAKAGEIARREVYKPELCENVLQRFDVRGHGAVDVCDLVIDVTSTTHVTLEITGRTGQKYIRANVPFDEKMSLGSWCWPVRT
jgi:osmotically-inducible protein OsmY